MIKTQRVVVTGMGAVTALGCDLATIKKNLHEATCGIRPITLFDHETLPVHVAGEALNFDPGTYLDSKEVRRNDRFIQMALASASQALEDAGLIGSPLLEQAGVVVGVGLGGLSTIEKAHGDLLATGQDRISPFFIPSVLSNLASGQISIKFKIKGPNFSVSSACASGSQAIGQAFHDIKHGRRRLWIAGGAEAAISPLGISGFSASRALSKNTGDVKTLSKPFHPDRDGFVLGEGAGMLILESLESAESRGAKIYGEILGYGISSDGYHVTSPDPEGTGAFTAMAEAIQEADISVSEIDYVNAHATSTQVGDSIEVLSIQKILGDQSSKTFVSSTKNLTGHPCGSAGSIESVFCLTMMNANHLSPAEYLEGLSQEDFPFLVPTVQRQPLQIQTLVNNSFGFGGVNTALVFKKFIS